MLLDEYVCDVCGEIITVASGDSVDCVCPACKSGTLRYDDSYDDDDDQW